MTFMDQLRKLKACDKSLQWAKGKTIEQAWEKCEKSDWMLWLLSKTDLDLVDPICDMAERVLHLVPEECQLACIWAISAAQRHASKDELDAAHSAANTASFYDKAAAASLAAYSAAYAAYAAYADAYVAAYAHQYAAYYAAYYARSSAACRKEEKKQCDILRKYFTIDQVREAFNKLVA